MAPTEQKILSNYLLVPAQLPAIVSLQEFVALFPRSLQSSPQVRTLYRDLQSQRNAFVDSVAEQIEEEAKHGKAMRRAVIRSRREADAQEQDDELEIEKMVSSAFRRIRSSKLTPFSLGMRRGIKSTASPPSSLTWRAPSVNSKASCS